MKILLFSHFWGNFCKKYSKFDQIAPFLGNFDSFCTDSLRDLPFGLSNRAHEAISQARVFLFTQTKKNCFFRCLQSKPPSIDLAKRIGGRGVGEVQKLHMYM